MALQTTTIHVIDGAVATVAPANAVPVKVTDACKITLFVKRSNHTAGSSTFSVQVSPNYSQDGVDAEWVTYNKLISNVANTSSETLTRTASIALSSNVTAMATFDMDNGDIFDHIRVSVAEVTDGTHDAWLVIQRKP